MLHPYSTEEKTSTLVAEHNRLAGILEEKPLAGWKQSKDKLLIRLEDMRRRVSARDNPSYDSEPKGLQASPLADTALAERSADVIEGPWVDKVEASVEVDRASFEVPETQSLRRDEAAERLRIPKKEKDKRRKETKRGTVIRFEASKLLTAVLFYEDSSKDIGPENRYGGTNEEQGSDRPIDLIPVKSRGSVGIPYPWIIARVRYDKEREQVLEAARLAVGKSDEELEVMISEAKAAKEAKFAGVEDTANKESKKTKKETNSKRAQKRRKGLRSNEREEAELAMLRSLLIRKERTGMVGHALPGLSGTEMPLYTLHQAIWGRNLDREYASDTPEERQLRERAVELRRSHSRVELLDMAAVERDRLLALPMPAHDDLSGLVLELALASTDVNTSSACLRWYCVRIREGDKPYTGLRLPRRRPRLLNLNETQSWEL